MRVYVIGSGMAGLSSAIRLRNLGFDVVVYEQNDYPGGKLTSIKLGDYRFDAGPSLFTMPHYVDELFVLSGKNPRDYFSYDRKDIICRYFWEDGKRLTAHSDKRLFAKEVERVFGVSKEKLITYWNKSKKKYELTHRLFLEKSLHKISTYLSFDTVKAILNLSVLDLNQSLNQVNVKEINEPHMVQFFNRFSTYNGSSPYKTPGIMSMIPHLEQDLGTFIPKNGMIDITNSLYRLAVDVGVEFRFNTNVEKILVSTKKVTGVIADGKVHNCDLLVSNMDVVPTYKELLPNEKRPHKVLDQQRSSSGIIFYWAIDKNFPELDLHNIFFSENYREEFECIFDKKELYNDPTVYVNISSKNVPEDAPSGCENWFVMINVPGNTGQDWDYLIDRAKKDVISKLSRVLNQDISLYIKHESILDPRGIESKTNSYQGSLYGASSNDKMAAFLRHPNFSSAIKGLYFGGGSVHPGGGIPLCLLSGKIVSDLIRKEYVGKSQKI